MICVAALATASAQADCPSDRFDKLRCIVTHAILKHGFYLFDVLDIPRWITVNHHEVGLFACGQRADFVPLAEKFRAIRSRDVNRLKRCKSRLNEQFHLPLVPESSDDSSVSCGIESSQQHTALLHELAFEF